MKSHIIIKQFAFSIVLFFLSVSLTIAATEEDLGQFNLSRLTAVASDLSPDKPVKIKQAALKQAFELPPDEVLEEVKVLVDKTGKIHSRHKLLFKGLRVWAHEVVVHLDKNKVPYEVNGLITKDIGADINSLVPSVDLATALNEAKAKHKKDKGNLNWKFRNENTELVIYVDPSSNKAKLAYYINFFADADQDNPTRPYFLIDANTKEILKQWEGLTTALVGRGPGGNMKIGLYQYGSDRPYLDVQCSSLMLSCTMETTRYRTIDLNRGTTSTASFKFFTTFNATRSVNGAYSPLNDLHFYGSIVDNMFRTWFAIAPLTFRLAQRAHYGVRYENAFWDGAYTNYGDGYNFLYPAVALDVVAHEVAHGFTEQNSGLVYSGQSGGVNEAFSDVSGEAAEYFHRGSNDWRVGADITKNQEALRYMNNPPVDGSSIDNSVNYKEGMDVHQSSGVFNKAFYLLATKAGWNVKKAYEIMVNANRYYWIPASTFSNAACGMMSAANDLSYNKQDVVDAFSTVGVTCNN